MRPELFDRMQAMLESIMKRDAQREEEHRAIMSAIEGLTQPNVVNSDTHHEIRLAGGTAKTQRFDLTRLSGGHPARDIYLMSLGGAGVSIETPDMLEPMPVTAVGYIFQEDNIHNLTVVSDGNGSSDIRIRVGYFTGETE